jgi:hypothetical protein
MLDNTQTDLQTVVAATKKAVSDFKFFCANCFQIIDVEGQICFLEFNNEQQEIWKAIQERRGRPVRIIVLKSRQIGVSTFCSAYVLWLMLTRTVKGIQLAHTDDGEAEVYGIIKFAVENLPKWFTNALNIGMLEFSGNTLSFSHTFSRLSIQTAGGKGIGQGGTKQVLHLTEVAFWSRPDDVLSSLFASFHETVSSVVLQESTGNGISGYFHDTYEGAKNGKNSYTPLFFPWYRHKAYSLPVPFGVEVVVPDELRPLYLRGKITREQLYWRQHTIADKYNGSEEKFKKSFPATEQEAWIQDSANFFSTTRVTERLSQVQHLQYDQGDILQTTMAPEFTPVGDSLRVFKFPVKDGIYVIGADTSSGVATSIVSPDNSSADVLDAQTGEQVAHIVVLCEPIEFAKKLLLIGQFYNYALINTESNGHGITVLNWLRDMGYQFLYHSRAYNHINKTWENRLGFYTGPKTRPYLLDKGRSAFMTGAITVNDQRTLVEMLAFVQNAKGKIAAIQGEHDDQVISLLLANIAREEYQPMLMTTVGQSEMKRRVLGQGSAVEEQPAFFHDARRRHLYPEKWQHPDLGLFY